MTHFPTERPILYELRRAKRAIAEAQIQQQLILRRLNIFKDQIKSFCSRYARDPYTDSDDEFPFFPLMFTGSGVGKSDFRDFWIAPDLEYGDVYFLK
jgi:hypothetical protein